MTKRAYYDKPWKAWYMQEEFGMRFVDWKGDDWNYNEMMSTGSYACEAILDAIGYIKEASPDKIYIHPDDMSMLDFLDTDETIYGKYFEQPEWIRRLLSHRYEVIYRGNQPFIWPEWEGEDG